MAEETLLQKIQREYSANKFRARSQQAKDWYEKRLKYISNLNRSRMLNDPLFIVSRKPAFGSLMMFFYEAKHAETLPYWDRFPLTLVVQPAEGGFYGLNLHYITPPLRALLLSRLYTVSNNKRFDESTKLNMTYALLKGSQKYRQFKPCFKHYLVDQVRSPFAIVPATEWLMSVYLPSEQFIGSSKEQVWKKSAEAL